jgi:hypothetical protein
MRVNVFRVWTFLIVTVFGFTVWIMSVVLLVLVMLVLAGLPAPAIVLANPIRLSTGFSTSIGGSCGRATVTGTLTDLGDFPRNRKFAGSSNSPGTVSILFLKISS